MTEGSALVGFGHLRRSLTLAHVLSDRVPVRLWVVCGNPDEGTDMWEHCGGLEMGAGPEPDFQSQLEILDLEPEPMRVQLLRSAPSTRRLSLDWFDPELLPDMTINLFDQGGQMRSAYSVAGTPERYFEGPEFAIIHPSLCALRPEAPKRLADIGHVVVTQGGADPSRRTLDALADLREHAPDSVRSTVIVGPLVPTDYEAEILVSAPSNSLVLRAPENFAIILSTADVVLCSGGGTLLESMCLGKVAVVYPQTPAEENHALFHAHAGACVMRWSMPEVMLSAALRNSLVAQAHQQVDGRGAERVAEAAQSLLYQV